MAAIISSRFLFRLIGKLLRSGPTIPLAPHSRRTSGLGELPLGERKELFERTHGFLIRPRLSVKVWKGVHILVVELQPTAVQNPSLTR